MGAFPRRVRVVLEVDPIRAMIGPRPAVAGQSVLEDCFTAAELAQLRRRPEARADEAPSIAARLAAKLAACRILDPQARVPGILGGDHARGEFLVSPIDEWPVSGPGAPSRPWAVRLRAIEVLLTGDGVPGIVIDSTVHPFSGAAWTSLSHDGGLAAALVVMDRPADRPTAADLSDR